MTYLGLDSVAQGFSPQQIVNDMRSVQARLIGLYVFNNDVSNPGTVVKSGAFVQEVERIFGQPCVLPIITIKTGDSPDPSFLVQDLLQWFPLAGRRVGHDLENTAFPPLPEAQALFAAERAAGFSPGIYGFQSTQDAYSAANPDWQWGVQAYAEGYGYLPPPYRMWQWTNNVLNYTYDGNSVDDAFSVVSGTFEPPLVGEDEEVSKQTMIPDATHQHFVYLVPVAAGQAMVYYRSYDRVAAKYTMPISVGGPVADSAGVKAQIDSVSNQLQVEARWADVTAGTVAHFWMNLPVGPWSSDTI